MKRKGQAKESKQWSKLPRMHDLLLEDIEQMRKPAYTPQYNLVLREIANCFNWKDQYAWPSAKYISRRTWISEGQVRTIIKVLREDGLLDVTPREQSTHEFRFPYLSRKVHHLLSGAPPSEQASPTGSSGVPLSAEGVARIPGVATPCSEDSRTVNEESSSVNHEEDPSTQPNRTVQKSGSVTEVEQRTDLSQTEIQGRIKTAVTELNWFLPDCELNAANLQDFVRRQDFQTEEFSQVMHWAVGKSNGRWTEKLKDVSQLAFWYSEIKGQWVNFYDTVRERNGGIIPDCALPKAVFRIGEASTKQDAGSSVLERILQELRDSADSSQEGGSESMGEDDWFADQDFGTYEINEEDLE